jgi:hypothetical protein
MESQRGLNRIKLIVTAIIAGATCYYFTWQAIGAVIAQQEDRSRVEIVGQEAPLKDRFGADDGAAFVLHFTGDIHGSLEPCG